MDPPNGKSPHLNATVNCNKNKSEMRKITADDYCTFQMKLEPSAILVNVTINSLAQCKYSQEISICGNKGVLVLDNSQQMILRTSYPQQLTKTIEIVKKLKTTTTTTDTNNNQTTTSQLDNSKIPSDKKSIIPNETNDINEQEKSSASFTNDNNNNSKDDDDEIDAFLSQYNNLEDKHPELPLIFIRGLFHYLSQVKQEFSAREAATTTTTTTTPKDKNSHHSMTNLDNLEHTRVVQSIIKNISISSESNRWIAVKY
jgi:hypothetical protein